MFCPKCGYKKLDNADFCFKCGFDLRIQNIQISKNNTISYVGFWKRFVALIIDSMILSVICIINYSVLGLVLAVLFSILGVDIIVILILVELFVFIINTVIHWLYFALFESSQIQATPGKMLLGIMVTDINSNRISFKKATGRYWGKVISTIILFIGFIMVEFNEKKQSLHDIMAGTLVIEKN